MDIDPELLRQYISELENGSTNDDVPLTKAKQSKVQPVAPLKEKKPRKPKQPPKWRHLQRLKSVEISN